uniref:Uncharacterized protein n=1 Tax=Zea mays TaxID=4577 RepID=A0A804Q0L1_MAIZE
MKCLYACGRSKRRTTDHTAPTGAAIACTTAEQHCPARAACSWCRATSAGTAAHDAPCDAAFAPPPLSTRLCCCGDGRGAVYGIAAACLTALLCTALLLSVPGRHTLPHLKALKVLWLGRAVLFRRGEGGGRTGKGWV